MLFPALSALGVQTELKPVPPVWFEVTPTPRTNRHTGIAKARRAAKKRKQRRK